MGDQTANTQELALDESSLQSLELGYILLEVPNDEIVIINNADAKGDRHSSTAAESWRTVHVLQSNDDEGTITTPPPSKKRGRPLDASHHCDACQLVIREDDGRLVLCLDDVPHFDGSTKSLSDRDRGPATCTCHRQSSLSDAVLLLGLLRYCREYVTIHTMRIYERCGSSSNSRNPSFLLQISVAFPQLSTVATAPTASGRRRYNILKSGTVRSSKANGQHHSSKGRKGGSRSSLLSHAVQLLLSMIRSDWKRLERYTNDPMSTVSLSSRRQGCLFPNHFSLSDLYVTIQGSSAQQSATRNNTNAGCGTMALLPPDIIVDKLAVFLTAKSLDSVRCTCKYLHDTLRAVVPGLKELSLYKHQVTSLAWMRLRETKLWTEADALQASSGSSVVGPGDDDDDDDPDLHRAVTGGQSTMLQSRDGQMRIRVQQSTGMELLPDDLVSLPRKVARGGLLTDDPGLGKTITVLSLILQTMGLSTQLPADSNKRIATTTAEDTQHPSITTAVDDDDDESRIFNLYWREQMTVEFRRPLLMKLMNRLVRMDRGGGRFPVILVQKAIDADQYQQGLNGFVRDIESAIEFYAPDDDQKSAAKNARALLHQLVAEFKQAQLKSARKSFSSASSKPNSAVAALLDQTNERDFLQSLVSSSSTLVVVPGVLVQHWQTQMNQHLDTNYFSRKTPLVYEFGKKKSMKVREVVEMLAREDCEYFPFIFVDTQGGTSPLPDPNFLSLFRIVLTSTQRMTNEWKNGSFQSQLNHSERDEFRERFQIGQPTNACSLLKVRWLRLIVDEGHSMARGQGSAIQFASWVSAERRWVMTGTPTKRKSAGELGQIKSLLKFLDHGFFTQRLDGNSMWKRGVVDPWKMGHFVGWFRLQSLLRCLMKRHTKLDIAELPEPRFNENIIPMSMIEVTTYNTLVCAVQSNLRITSMDGETSGAQDSLLHRSQAKHARSALANVRRVCVGYSRVVPTLGTKYYLETLDLMKMHGFNDEQTENVKQYLHRAEGEGLTKCGCCLIELSTLLLFPCCGGLVCPECFDGGKECILCSQEFDVDDFQRLQPGFQLEWHENMSVTRHPTRQSTGAPVQIAATAPSQNLNAPINVAGLANPLDGGVLRPAQGLRRTRRFGDGHKCVYNRAASHGKCFLCLTEHDSCHLINKESRCQVCFRKAEDCPIHESKSFYLVKTLLALYNGCLHNPRALVDPSLGVATEDRPLKVIIFSQFRQGLNMAGTNLLLRFGSACVAEYWGKYRSDELRKFTYDRDCFCMLLGRDGSEGLDLSFVTHIFFLEEIMDQSLKDQAVARAWRMGAKGRVHVETLTAQNSVEETIQRLDAAIVQRRPDLVDDIVAGGGALVSTTASTGASTSGNNSNETKRAKTEILLRSLRFNTDYHDFTSVKRPQQEEDSALADKPLPSPPRPNAEPPTKRQKLVSFKD